MRRVVIDRRFTYETDLPVGIGDIVDLPGSGSSKAHWTGEVTALESDYTGECRKVNAIVKSKALEENQRTVECTTALQSLPVADAIRDIVAEVEKYGPVTLAAFAAAAGRLLAAARGPVAHRAGFFGSRNPGVGADEAKDETVVMGVAGPLSAETPEEVQT